MLISVGTLTSVFKDNMSLRSHKSVEIIVNLNFWLVDGSIQIQILEAQTHWYCSYGSGSGTLVLSLAELFSFGIKSLITVTDLDSLNPDPDPVF